jgi:hypothetical protein
LNKRIFLSGHEAPGGFPFGAFFYLSGPSFREQLRIEGSKVWGHTWVVGAERFAPLGPQSIKGMEIDKGGCPFFRLLPESDGTARFRLDASHKGAIPIRAFASKHGSKPSLRSWLKIFAGALVDPQHSDSRDGKRNFPQDEKKTLQEMDMSIRGNFVLWPYA